VPATYLHTVPTQASTPPLQVAFVFMAPIFGSR